MKKLIYILSVFVAILLLNSCNKEIVNKCDDKDPFAIKDNSQTRGANDDNNVNNVNGGIIDPDEDDDDMDEDDDTIIDPDEDDDDMDEDDDSIESRVNGNQGA
jgi:hypothetical protein